MLFRSIGTVEKLGSMTPEELDSIEGIESDNVELIQSSVISYYQQFEGPQQPPPQQEFVEGMPIHPPLDTAHSHPPAGETAAGEETAEQETTSEEIAEPPDEGAAADALPKESDNIKDSE